MPLHESATTGDRLSTLRDLRDLLALKIEACDSLRDLAALAGRLQAVLDQIAALEPPAEEEGDEVDEVAARRASRGSSPTASTTRPAANDR